MLKKTRLQKKAFAGLLRVARNMNFKRIDHRFIRVRDIFDYQV